MKRRDFLKKAGLGTAAAAAATAVNAPYVHAGPKKVSWKMVTTWPPKLPYLQTGADRIAQRVEEMTEGNFKIKVYAGGELVPPMGCFDAVSRGDAQIASSAAYYWAGKLPASQWFCAVPFGLNGQGMMGWMYQGGGLKLWEEAYAPFNLVPRPGGSTGVQMGGWFNKKIESVDDLKGLKMRIPGLGGKVLAKAGCTVVLTAGGEIFTSLERGVIDATEWVGPLHDQIMGFYKVAKYYYYPGWHEPGSLMEYFFNKQAYEALPKDYQHILDAACAESFGWIFSGFESANGAALQNLITEHKVELVRFPESVMDHLRKLSEETLQEITAADPLSKKVHESFTKYKKQIGPWGTVSEQAYYELIAGKYALKV